MRIRYSIKDNKVDIMHLDGNMEIQDHLCNSYKKFVAKG